jgi:hypothetical protein
MVFSNFKVFDVGFLGKLFLVLVFSLFDLTQGSSYILSCWLAELKKIGLFLSYLYDI